MGNLRFNTTLQQEIGNRLGYVLDLGAPIAGYFDIMSGVQPASGKDPITSQIILARMHLSLPAAQQTDVNGRVVLNAIADATAPNAVGIASWARWYDGSGQNHFDCDVGVAGATLNLTSTSITTNPGLVSVVSFYFIIPAGN